MQLKLDLLEQILNIVDRSPKFDVRKLRAETIKDPKWVAFGAGNIFRGYIARIAQDLVNCSAFDRGVNVIQGRDYEMLDTVYEPNDNLAVSVTLANDGNFSSEIIANIAEVVKMTLRPERVKEIFRKPSLQIISYTITEKGYDIYNSKGELSDVVKSALDNDPCISSHVMVASVGFLYERYLAKLPVTLLSLDNLSKNGSILKKAILRIAEEYVARGKLEREFLDYLNDDKWVTYPWTMIDKITPGPDPNVANYLQTIGFEDVGPFKLCNGAICSKFVNSEEAEYLAIEDKFANGRPDFSKAGVFLVDRATVEKIETMKVTACLNPLHTTLAVYGSLLGYDKIWQEMNDPVLVKLIKRLAYDEALPVVEDPIVIDPVKFVDEVINKRFANPYLQDSPQRIATDTSMKISIRFGKTINTYIALGKDVTKLRYIPIVLAGWLRYLLAVDDNGCEFTPSPDPCIEELQESLSEQSYERAIVDDKIIDLLSNEKYFGVNLNSIGLAENVLRYFSEMCQGKGSVRRTLEKYTK